METIKKTYNEETDSFELRVRGKLILNISDEDMDIIEAENGGRDFKNVIADMLLDVAMRHGV